MAPPASATGLLFFRHINDPGNGICALADIKENFPIRLRSYSSITLVGTSNSEGNATEFSARSKNDLESPLTRGQHF